MRSLLRAALRLERLAVGLRALDRLRDRVGCDAVEAPLRVLDFGVGEPDDGRADLGHGDGLPAALLLDVLLLGEGRQERAPVRLEDAEVRRGDVVREREVEHARAVHVAQAPGGRGELGLAFGRAEDRALLHREELHLARLADLLEGLADLLRLFDDRLLEAHADGLGRGAGDVAQAVGDVMREAARERLDRVRAREGRARGHEHLVAVRRDDGAVADGALGERVAARDDVARGRGGVLARDEVGADRDALEAVGDELHLELEGRLVVRSGETDADDVRRGVVRERGLGVRVKRLAVAQDRHRARAPGEAVARALGEALDDRVGALLVRGAEFEFGAAVVVEVKDAVLREGFERGRCKTDGFCFFVRAALRGGRG